MKLKSKAIHFYRVQRRILILFTLSLFVTASFGKDVTSQLPAAPKGFKWTALTEIDGAILLPKGWHFRKESPDSSTQAYFVTKQAIKGKNGQFQTGYSLNVIKGVKAKTGTIPTEYAANFVQNLKAKGKFKDEDRKKINEYFEAFYLSLLIEDSTAKTIQAFSITANDSTDTIYIAFFEAPADKWNTEKDTGLQILSNQAFEEKY